MNLSADAPVDKATKINHQQSAGSPTCRGYISGLALLFLSFPEHRLSKSRFR